MTPLQCKSGIFSLAVSTSKIIKCISVCNWNVNTENHPFLMRTYQHKMSMCFTGLHEMKCIFNFSNWWSYIFEPNYRAYKYSSPAEWAPWSANCLCPFRAVSLQLLIISKTSLPQNTNMVMVWDVVSETSLAKQFHVAQRRGKLSLFPFLQQGAVLSNFPSRARNSGCKSSY